MNRIKYCPSADLGEKTRIERPSTSVAMRRRRRAAESCQFQAESCSSCDCCCLLAAHAVVKPDQLFANCGPVREEKSRDRSINRTDSNLGVELKPKTKGLCSGTRPESKTGAGGRRKAAAGQVSSSLRLTWLVLGGYFHNVGNTNTYTNTKQIQTRTKIVRYKGLSDDIIWCFSYKVKKYISQN